MQHVNDHIAKQANPHEWCGNYSIAIDESLGPPSTAGNHIIRGSHR